jgi:hypothetical protein
VLHDTYTDAMICNSSPSEKSESSAPLLQEPPSRSTRGGFGFFSLARYSGTGKAGPLAVVGWYSPECVEGEFSEVRMQDPG